MSIGAVVVSLDTKKAVDSVSTIVDLKMDTNMVDQKGLHSSHMMVDETVESMVSRMADNICLLLNIINI